jgi:bifunctional DNase/RNase
MLTPIAIQKIELSLAYTSVYFTSEDRVFVIYLQAQSGKLLQHLIAKSPVERPTSFDVILSLMTGCDLKPLQILIENEKEGVFYTKIFLEKTASPIKEILEIDARPTEALALAIKTQIPIFINTSLLTRLNNLNLPIKDSKGD